MYLGQPAKGIGILIAAIIAGAVWGPLFWIVWAFGIYDSYTTAQKMNKGDIPYSAPKIGLAIGLIAAEIIIFILIMIIFAAMLFSLGSHYY